MPTEWGRGLRQAVLPAGSGRSKKLLRVCSPSASPRQSVTPANRAAALEPPHQLSARISPAQACGGTSSAGSRNAAAGTSAKNHPGGVMSPLSPWKKDDSEMLVIVGNGWLLSSSGFTAKTS